MSKFLLLLLLVVAGVWLWRAKRLADPERPKPPPFAEKPLEMVRCALCSVHIPVADAVSGRAGGYCSPAHRQQAEP